MKRGNIRIVGVEGIPADTLFLLPEPPPGVETVQQYLEWLKANPGRAIVLRNVHAKDEVT